MEAHAVHGMEIACGAVKDCNQKLGMSQYPLRAPCRRNIATFSDGADMGSHRSRLLGGGGGI